MSETLVTFSVDDTSPTIIYSPIRDTFSTPNLIAGWNPYFNDSGFARTQGDVGVGASLHITSLDGARLGIQWRGTGITLLGNATLANYTLTLNDTIIPPSLSLPSPISDPTSPSPSNPDLSANVLANIQNLPDALHTLTLTAQIQAQGSLLPNASMIVFDQAILFSSPVAVDESVSFQNQTLPDTAIAFRGRWSVITTPDGAAVHTTNTLGDNATVAFNGTTLLILGPSSPSSGNYTVTLDNTTSPTLSAKSSFTQPDALLFFATDLGEGEHVVTLTNVDEGGGSVGVLVGGMRVVVKDVLPTPTPTPPPSTTPSPISGSSTPSFSPGTIAAFALAGILAFLILTSLLFFFLIYRPRRQARRRRRAQRARAEGWRASAFVGGGGEGRGGGEKGLGEGAVIGAGAGAIPNRNGSVLDITNNPPSHSSHTHSFMSLSEKDHPAAAGAAAYLDNDPHRSSKSITNRLSAISDGLKKWRQGAVRGSLGGTGLGAIWFRHSGAGGGNGAGQRGAGPSVGSSASESDLSRHAYAPNINLNTGINPANAPSPSNPSANNSHSNPNTTNPTAALAALTHRPSSAPTTSSLPSSSSSAQRARAARKGKMRQRASEAYAQFGPNSPAVAGSPADDDEDEEYGAVGLAYGGGYTGGGGGYGRGKDEEGQRRGKEQRTSWTPSFLLDLPLVGRRASRRESRRISGGGDNGGQNRRQTQRRSFFAFFTPSPTRPSSQALSTPYQPPSQPQPPPPPSQPQPQSQLQYTPPSPQPNLASAFNLSATSTDPTPPTPPPTLAPPSYAASLSQSNRDSDPPSSLIPSGPRSVSDVDADPTRFSGSGGGGGGAYGGAYAYSTSPYREDSYGYGSGTPQHAFLLHEGSPETGVSGGLSSIGAGSASAVGGGASAGASAGMGEAAEGEGEEDEASEDASIKGVVGTGIGVLVAGAGAGVVSSGSPGVRPLPDVVRYQQQQKQQQGQRKRMSIFSTSAPPLTPATPTPHNLQRKIIDPRLIDSPPTQHKTPQRQYNRASDIEPFSTSGTDADASIIEPHSMRAVLRSLSPRTSRLLPVPPPPPRQQHQHQQHHQQPHSLAISLPVAKEEEGEMESPQSTSSPTRRLLPPSPGGASGTEQESGWSWIVPARRRISTASAGNAGVGSGATRGVKPLPRTPTSDEFGDGELVEGRASGVEGGADGVFLDVRETSPFRVDFGSVSRGTSVRALPPTTTRGTPLSEESANGSARRMERRSRGSRVSVGAGSAISANGSVSGGSGSGGSGNASVKAPSGISEDSFNSDPAYYTAGGSVNYKPARNTFGAASSSHDHGTLPTHVRKASSSESMTGGGGHSISGGMSSHPFRISDLVQGSSSRLPFRLTTISFQDAAQRAASTTAAAQPAAPAETSTTTTAAAAAAQPTTNPPASGNPSPATSSEGVISFLDFTSSREGSLRVPSEKSLKQAANSKSKSKSKHKRQLPAPPPPIVVPELNSRWSNTTVPSIATTAPDAPGAAGSNAAVPVAGSSNQAQELQVESSDTGPVAGSSHQPQSHRSSSNTHSTDPVHVHPMLEDMESPTESLPMSTSEIRFRHSDSEEGHGGPAGLDDDTSINISISQPPTEGYSLSSAPPDMSNIPEEYRPRPFDPNVLVSRVLGLSSPTSSVTQRPLNHSRTQSNIAMSSATASVFHISSRHDSNYDLPSNLRSGQN